MKLKVLGMALVLTLTGCASYPGDQVPETPLPSMASYQQRPSVFVEFTFYHLDAGIAPRVSGESGEGEKNTFQAVVGLQEIASVIRSCSCGLPP